MYYNRIYKLFHLVKVDHESGRCFVHTEMDIHFEIFITYIYVFILFYVDSLFSLLAQLTKTQKENMIARMKKGLVKRGKIDSYH